MKTFCVLYIMVFVFGQCVYAANMRQESHTIRPTDLEKPSEPSRPGKPGAVKVVLFVMDRSGDPIGGVSVSVRINNEPWVLLGTTKDAATNLGSGFEPMVGQKANFIQMKSMGGRQGDKVKYRLQKTGYDMETLIYTIPVKNGSGGFERYYEEVIMKRNPDEVEVE